MVIKSYDKPVEKLLVGIEEKLIAPSLKRPSVRRLVDSRKELMKQSMPDMKQRLFSEVTPFTIIIITVILSPVGCQIMVAISERVHY